MYTYEGGMVRAHFCVLRLGQTNNFIGMPYAQNTHMCMTPFFFFFISARHQNAWYFVTVSFGTQIDVRNVRWSAT